MTVILVVLTILTLWIIGQVIMHFFSDYILWKIELLEAEWKLHKIRRNKIILDTRAKYKASKVSHLNIEEVPKEEAERLRLKFKKKKAAPTGATSINL